MTDLFVKCGRCDRGYVQPDGPPETGPEPCPDCVSIGFVPYKPPADVRALATELLHDSMSRSTSRNTEEIERDWGAKIAAFCEEREADLRKDRDRLKQNAWAWSRGLIGQKAYTTEELQGMFAPYVENGDVTGLSPREARLLETLIETGEDNLRLVKEDAVNLRAEVERLRAALGATVGQDVDEYVTRIVQAALKGDEG